MGGGQLPVEGAAEMIETASSPILRLIRQFEADPRVRGLTDLELLRQFQAQQDEGAFHAVLCRHGQMVLDVCGSVLANEADTEDAFQATFLILARKAGSIRKLASLGSWLHGVAHRTALKMRAQSASRRKHEAGAPLPQASNRDELSWREVRQVVHEELNRLPERFRTPLVLCYLEGATQEAAAVQLKLAKSTLRERLERGRGLLKNRLLRRGLGPTALLAAAAWPVAVSAAALPAPLVASTIQAASWFAAGQALPAGAASARALVLAKGALHTMIARKLLLALLLLVGGGLGVGIAMLSAGAGGQERPNRPLDEKKADPPPERNALPQRNADVIGPKVKGLQAKVSLAKETFAVGVAIPVKYVVKNVSKEEQTLWHSGFWPNHVIIVKDAGGKEPPLTPFGEQCRKAFSPGGERSKNVPWKVPAGGEDAAYEPYDLTKLYDLAKPGRYTVQYVYEEKQAEGWQGRLPSNEAAFEVVAKEDRQYTIEKDGVQFELLVPKRDWPIPENKPEARNPVTLGLRITNKTGQPLRFCRYDNLFPEMTGPDGKALSIGYERFRTPLKKEADCPLLKPGESATFMLEASLTWHEGKMRLGGSRFGGQWGTRDALEAGSYRVSIRYRNHDKEFTTSEGTVLKDVWTGEIATPFVAVTLSRIAVNSNLFEREPPTQDAIHHDLKKLQGTWHMVACEEGGKPFAPENINPNDFFTFEGTTFYFKSGMRRMQGDFTIDPSKTPKWMDQTATGGDLVFKGIYEFQGDKLRLFLGPPGGERPTEFKTKEGDKLWLRTFERVKPSVPTVRQIADSADVARMKKYYPHGFNFVDTMRADGKIVWTSKAVVNDKVEERQWEFATLEDFQRALLKETIAKEAAFEVHRRRLNPKLAWGPGAFARAQQIIDWLKE